jgi:hypothetical protein
MKTSSQVTYEHTPTPKSPFSSSYTCSSLLTLLFLLASRSPLLSVTDRLTVFSISLPLASTRDTPVSLLLSLMFPCFFFPQNVPAVVLSPAQVSKSGWVPSSKPPSVWSLRERGAPAPKVGTLPALCEGCQIQEGSRGASFRRRGFIDAADAQTRPVLISTELQMATLYESPKKNQSIEGREETLSHLHDWSLLLRVTRIWSSLMIDAAITSTTIHTIASNKAFCTRLILKATISVISLKCWILTCITNRF